MDSGKHALSSTLTPSHPPPRVEEVVVVTKPVTTSTVVSPPVVATTTLTTDHVSKEAYVTETSRQSPYGSQPVTAEQVSPATAAASALEIGCL